MRVLRVAAVLVALVGATIVGRPYVHGLAFVVRAADMQGTARRLADLDTVAVHERLVAIPTADGTMRARAYEPDGTPSRVALLVSGLHPSGIDEPRLVRLARQLAANHLVIVTPDIPELARFEITPRITEAIERSAVWLATQSGLAPDGKVGLMGISFSGGLSLVAAARPSLAGHVSFVFAFGGHEDLPRVIRYLCTGQEPYPPGQIRLKAAGASGGSARAAATPAVTAAEDAADHPFVRQPHDYGVAVILLGVADSVVPRSQVDALRETVRRYLWASALDGGVDKPRAEAEFAAVRAAARQLPEPSRTLMTYAVDRDVAHLGARLLPYLNRQGGDPALSLSRSPKPSVPVFLLHGIEDNVIPSIESEYIANDLRGRAQVRLLLSGLISHAEADRPVHVGDVMQLASFWGDLLSR
jgi:dienelactone hydrolase